MPKTITEELQLNTKEGRKRFYEKLVAHKDDLLKYYSVKLPDYDQWEKDYATKMSLVETVNEYNKKQAKLEEKFTVKDHKFGRLYLRMLQLNGENADKNNQDLFDMASKNDRKGFADAVVKKLLSIDTKKELGNIPGKSAFELAQMYIEDSTKYDVALIVDDLLTNFGDCLEDDVKKKLQENKGDFNSLVVYFNSLSALSDELFPYIPSPEVENLDNFGQKNIQFNEFDKNLHVHSKIQSFLLTAANPTLKVLTEYKDAHEKLVGEKIDDLLAACKDSEDKSVARSKQYETMKKALDDFKKNYKKDSKTAEKAKKNLKIATQNYLAYKAGKSLNQKSHGAVAAAGGILELVDEIDAHKPLDENDIKPFIKHSEAEDIYEQRANEAFGKGKDELRAFNEFMKNGVMKENLNKIIGAIEESGNSSHRDSDLSGKMYKQLIAIRNKNAEGTDITYDEMVDLKNTATEYLSYKNKKGYNKNALGKIAAADGILSFVNAFESKDESLVKDISTEKNAVDKIMEAVKKDKSIAPVYRAKKEKVSYTDLLKNEIRANSKKGDKKAVVAENVVEQEKKEAVAENVVEQEKKASVVENVIEQEKKEVIVENIVEQEKKELEKKEPEKKEEAQKPAEKLQNVFKDNEEFIALQKKVKNTIKFTSNEFDDASTFSGRQNHFAGYVSLRNLDKKLDKIVDKNYSILDLNEMEKSFEDITAGKTVVSTIKSKPFQKVIQENPFRNMDEKLKPLEELYNDYSAEVSKAMTKAENKGKEANKDANKEM